MSGIKAWRTRSGLPPAIRDYPVAAGIAFKALDPVVLVSYTTASRLRLPNTQANMLDLENDGGDIVGMLGLAAFDLETTSAAGVLVQNVPSTVDPASQPIYPAPSYAALIDNPANPNDTMTGTTPDIGAHRLQVLIANDDLEFLIDVTSGGSATTVDRTLIGRDVGLYLNGTIFTADVGVTDPAAGAAFAVTDVDETQPNYNASATSQNAVWVRVKSTHQQADTGILYVAADFS